MRTTLPLTNHSVILTVSSLLLISSLLTTSELQAAEQKSATKTDTTSEEKNTGWSGELSIGFNRNAGNVNTKSNNLGLKLKKEAAPWRYRILGEGSTMDVSNRRITEKYTLDGQADYVLPNENYWFGYAAYDSNKFARIDKRFVELAGYGMKLINSPKQKLTTQIGLGTRQSTYTDNFGKDNETMAHFGSIYNVQLTDNTTFTEDFMTNPGSKNRFALSTTSLQVKMSKKTSLKLSYNAAYNSKDFPNTKHTDTTSNVSFVVGF